jgi:UDP-MurNAc hydroxylase
VLITYLGHAGFCVETSKSIIIMDPWLSPSGAFDSGWFQYPCNHHLAPLVQEKFTNPSKDRYLYISHEHKDHFDLEFLNSLVVRDFHLVIPFFRRAALRELLADYRCRGIITCRHGEKIPLTDGYIQLYLDDSGLNRDSAILVYSDENCFLNMNDCKLHDQLKAIKKEKANIDVLACQFSGATWHPTCYDYPKDAYERVSKKKMTSKFEATAQAIEIVNPKLYLPSAGPPCFLDPALFHINFEPSTIFPRAPKLLAYLKERLQESCAVYAPEIMPGDTIDVSKGDFVYKAPERVSENGFEEYMKSYAAKYAGLFENHRHTHSQKRLNHIFSCLRRALEDKLTWFTSNDRLDRSLYLQFQDAPDKILHVNFKAHKVEEVSEIPSSNYYLLTSPSWQIARVVDGELTWEDFALTFRMRLSREPDVYETLIQGFLILEPEDLTYFCANLSKLKSNTERIVVRAGTRRYYVDRFCPHQAAELSQGWIEDNRYLVCSRHRWRFDLHNRGLCETSGQSINAFALEEDCVLETSEKSVADT